MAYVAPRTWVGGETITAVLLNAQVRDNQKALSDARTAFTPTLTATTTNPTLGTAGTIEGGHLLLNKLCVVSVDIKFGTSGTAAGSGDLIIGALPADPKQRTGLDILGGGGVLYDISATTPYFVRAERSAANAVKLRVSATSGFVTHAAPVAWTVNDEIHLDFIFEVA